MIDFHVSSERQEWCIMELLLGLYLFSLVFLLFPFLLSCLSCDSFCCLPFRLRFFLLIPVFLFLYILFFLLLHLHFVKLLLFLLWFLSACKCSSSSFLHFHPAVSFSRLVLRSGTKPKRRQKWRQNSREAAWHGPGQELANLLPHPATTATTTIATVGPSCAFAAGICLTNTSKAPTAPASPRLLLLLLLLLLMLMLLALLLVLVLVLVLVAVAAAVTAVTAVSAVTCCDLLWLAVTCCDCCRCCHCCCHCYCCCYCHCYCHCYCYCLCSCFCCLRYHCCFF